jgi:hypothetical protein
MCLRQKQVDVIDLARASFGGKLGEQHREIERDRGGEHSIRLRREIRRDRGEDCRMCGVATVATCCSVVPVSFSRSFRMISEARRKAASASALSRSEFPDFTYFAGRPPGRDQINPKSAATKTA